MSLPRAPGWCERSKSSTVDTFFESKWAIDDDNCLFLVFGGGAVTAEEFTTSEQMARKNLNAGMCFF